MKRILALILALVMVFTFISCGKKDEPAGSDATTNDTTVGDGTVGDGTVGDGTVGDGTVGDGTVEDGTAADDTGADDGAASGDTLGTTLLGVFKATAEANPDMTAEEIANAVISDPVIQFGPATMPVEEGFLSGFDNFEVKGFEEGVMFAPMIGSIAFVGYVFTLADGADVDAFIADLEANANPRWNICVEAEETVTGSVGNKVFFLMCPKSIEG